MLILFLFHFRHCLHLFGHNCHRANLMDVVQFKDEFNVELVGGTNNKSVPYSVSTKSTLDHSLALQLIAL